MVRLQRVTQPAQARRWGQDAGAFVEGLTLVSADRAFAGYDLALRW